MNCTTEKEKYDVLGETVDVLYMYESVADVL